MTSRTFISVDPGGSGAIAWSNRNGFSVVPIPDTRRGCIDIIKDIKSEAVNPDTIIAYMEKISGFIPDGGASQMFEFGKKVERLGCILECFDIRTIEMIPRTWQKHLALGNSDRIPIRPGMDEYERKSAKAHNATAKRDWKRKLKEEAERRFPQLKVTLKTCDALLLLDVAIMLERDGLGI